MPLVKELVQHFTAFDEVDVPAAEDPAFPEALAGGADQPPLELEGGAADGAAAGGNPMEDMFNFMPTPDATKMDDKGMEQLRNQAFDQEDNDAAKTWAANLGLLKEGCYEKDDLPNCKTLATESMYFF